MPVRFQILKLHLQNKSFTLAELLIVVSIVVVLLAIVILAINPAERMAKARDDQREQHLNTIWNAIEQKIYQEGGKWDCTEVPQLPEEPTVIGSGECNLYPCLYPNFINNFESLIDPQTGSFKSLDNYDTGYKVWQEQDTKKISLSGQGETRMIYIGDSPLLDQGEECGFDSECESGHCVDGLCCNDSCTGDCEACNLTGTEGSCTAREADDNSEVTTPCHRCNGTSTTSVAYDGDDGLSCAGDCTHCDSGSCVNWPNNTQQEDCTGFCQACQSGVCGYVTAGTDPYEACEATGCASGYCDGAGECAIYSGGEKAACDDCYYCNDSDPDCDLVAAGADPNGDCSSAGCLTGNCDGAGDCQSEASVAFTYKGVGVNYQTVEHNGECWMDRNLGASRVATAYNDSEAYGDLFQWGRLDDLHQNRDSGTTETCSSSDDPGHSNFIITTHVTSYDWRCPENENLWQGDGGINDPCPDGWRLPTIDEWETERQSWSENNYNGAFASPLKLTVGGLRSSFDERFSGVGSSGNYWSSDVHWHIRASCDLYFYSTGAYTDLGAVDRAAGLSVRCIQDAQ